MLTKRTFIQFEIFSNQPIKPTKHFQTNQLHEIVKKITRKINALSKKRSFLKMFFENPVPLHMRSRMQPICHFWQNGRYFYKTHLATLAKSKSSRCDTSRQSAQLWNS